MKVRLPKSPAPNMQNLMAKAQKAQEEMEKESEKLEEKEYSATSGGEAVKVTINGKPEIIKIDIKPEVVDPNDTELLSDMIMAAANEAIKKANTEKDELMQSISSKINIPGLI